MTTCCFIFIPGILENQDSEFLAWVLVSTWGIMCGGLGSVKLGVPGSDWGADQDLVLGENGLPNQHGLASPSEPFLPNTALCLSGPRSHCVHEPIKEKEI